MALTYGVEIECIVPTPRGGHYREVGRERGPVLASAIEAAGVPCVYAGYSHTTNHRQWKIVTDGSLRVPTLVGIAYTGLEIVSPPLTEGDPVGIEQIEKVCRVLEDLGATVNKSCGLHVHVGVNTLPFPAIRKLVLLYSNFEEVIDGLVPLSRRANANSYAQSIKSFDFGVINRARTVDTIRQAINYGGRYSKVNLNSFVKYGTIEFRQHSGTVKAEKIIKWAGLCMGLVSAAARTADEPTTVTVNATQSEYWQNGRRTQTLYRLLTRPEGVTAEEARIELAVRSRPNIRWHLQRAGATTAAYGRRDGREVFKLRDNETVPVQQTPTLDSMLTLVNATPEDITFWKERQMALATMTAPSRWADQSVTGVEHLP